MSSQNNLQYDVYNSLRENLPTIKVKDEYSEEIFEYSYQDFVKYHGYYFLCGLSLGYKLITHVFSLLNEIPQRGHFYFYSGVGPKGKGVNDGIELITRAKSHNQLNTDISLLNEVTAPITPVDTKFYFEIGYKESYFKVKLKENVVPANFTKYAGMSAACQASGEVMSDEDQIRLKLARKEFESVNLSSKAEDLFEFTQITVK